MQIEFASFILPTEVKISVATIQKTNAPQIEKLLFKPREAATVIGASPSWVYARIEDGSIKSVRLAGRMVRIRREDLMSFIDASSKVSA